MTIVAWPHNASSAPWSSTPRSIYHLGSNSAKSILTDPGLFSQVTPPADVQGMLSLDASTAEATAEQSPGVDRSDMTNSEEHDLEAASADASKQVVPSSEEAISPSRRTGSSGNSSGSEVAPTLSSGQRIVSKSGRMYKVCVRPAPPRPSLSATHFVSERKYDGPHQTWTRLACSFESTLQ